MIDRAHDLPITKQAAALTISRTSVYYLPRPVSAADLALMRWIDELHLEYRQPYTWTADPDQIIAAVRRGHQMFNSIH